MHLADGREVSAPLSFYPTLSAASPRQRRNWSLLGEGEGFEWPDFDLQLSTIGILEGKREHVPPSGFRDWLRRRQDELGMHRPPASRNGR